MAGNGLFMWDNLANCPTYAIANRSNVIRGCEHPSLRRLRDAPLVVTLDGEARRGVRDTADLPQGGGVRVSAAGQMEPIITSAVQEDGPLHSRTRRRGWKVDPGPVAYLRHGIVSVIRLRQAGQQI